jgi:putative holliday junction resolvase
MRALGLDVGSKTIGLARSDSEGLIACAWDVVERRGHEQDAREIARRVELERFEHVVVGLPLELDGREGRRVKAVRRFLAVLEPKLAELTGPMLPPVVHTWDERFSTAAAERTLIEADMSRARRKQKIDAMAAQFILQGWLDARNRTTDDSHEVGPHASARRRGGT